MIRTVIALFLAAVVSPASAEIEADEVGRSLTLPRAYGDHWVWLNEPLFRHAKLYDADSGRVLGIVDVAGSLTGRHPFTSRKRGETYILETFYSRGTRGTRKDFVTIYNSKSLAVDGEIEIPPRTADVGHGLALAAVLDDERFLVVFNQEPANSVSVIDLERRSFVGEITTAGCALVYPVGPRSFGMLCGDGTALRVDLDAEGKQSKLSSSEPFFDVVEDPLTEKGARKGASTWVFSSFEGYLHEIDFAGERPRLVDRWSLFTDGERADKWRIGGQQHLALHSPTGRLFSAVHQGEKGSHKEAGSEIWVYDFADKKRVQILEPPSLMAAFLIRMGGVDPDSFVASLMRFGIPSPGVHSLVVTPDEDAPFLFVRHRETGAAGVFDAKSGEFLRFLDETGLGGGLMAVP